MSLAVAYGSKEQKNKRTKEQKKGQYISKAKLR